jgi:hypothetical protein
MGDCAHTGAQVLQVSSTMKGAVAGPCSPFCRCAQPVSEGRACTFYVHCAEQHAHGSIRQLGFIELQLHHSYQLHV